MSRASRVVCTAVLFLLIASPIAAQSANDGMKLPFEIVKGYVTKAAEQVAEANYSFKPTPEVRTFAQLFGHIANANFMICSMASGLENPNAKTDFETLTAKADLQKALADSFAFCDRAWAAVTPANGAEPVDLFGMKFTRASALPFNTAHDWEHYGNIVTYMRLKGMVPPSSGGGGMN